MSWKDYYEAPQRERWQGRSEPNTSALYVHEKVQCVDLRSSPFPVAGSQVLVGFACDEGIQRNQGRRGAKEGPTAFRNLLSRCSCSVLDSNSGASNKGVSIVDAGNIVCEDEDLEKAQQALSELLNHLYQRQCHPLVIGGGHETAWAHYQGFADHIPEKLTIVNFDAHFDLRDLMQQSKGTSGSSFWQIAQIRKKQVKDFDYHCIGIQPLSNHAGLFRRAKELNVKVILASELTSCLEAQSMGALQQRLQTQLETAEVIYLSVCLDVFAVSVAPGVSAPQALGLYPWQAWPLLQTVLQTQKVVAADIVELAPSLDRDDQTARLAASIAMEILQAPRWPRACP